MKKPDFSKYRQWKNWTRPSFSFYFVLIVTIVVIVAIWVAGIFSGLIGNIIEEIIPSILMMVGFGIVIGIILSYLLGLTLLKPIKKLESAMNSVAEGDLEIKVEEKGYFDEIENINHSFNLMMKELRANQLIQKDFISNVSHEFKTPLSAIEGYATLLQDSTLTQEERDEYLKEIISTTSELTELVGNILLLSKISNQAIAYPKQKYLLDEQLRRVVVNLEPNWSKKNIEIYADFEQIEFNGNENLMSNVWRNLIENAIKYSPNDAKIVISLKRVGEEIEFFVVDQGEGIKEEDKKHIFDKFYQADTSHKQEGNGLGLALVKNILDIFGGKIIVENVKPQGAKFIVILKDE